MLTGSYTCPPLYQLRPAIAGMHGLHSVFVVYSDYTLWRCIHQMTNEKQRKLTSEKQRLQISILITRWFLKWRKYSTHNNFGLSSIMLLKGCQKYTFVVLNDNTFNKHNMDQVKQKHILWHMQTTTKEGRNKPGHSTVWSVPTFYSA